MVRLLARGRMGCTHLLCLACLPGLAARLRSCATFMCKRHAHWASMHRMNRAVSVSAVYIIAGLSFGDAPMRTFLSPALTRPRAHSANAPGRGDIGTDVESAFMRDELLTNVSIYWLSGCITSSMRLYYEAMHSGEVSRLSSTYCEARPGRRK